MMKFPSGTFTNISFHRIHGIHRNALQTIQDQLNRPTKFKARLNSLVALQQAQSIPVQMCNNSLSATDMATIHQVSNITNVNRAVVKRIL